MSGPSGPGLPVDACRSSGAEGRKQSSEQCLCRLRPAQGKQAVYCTDDPPLCHGGLHLSRTSPPEGSAAYLAAAATTHKETMLNGPETLRSFDEPSGVQLWTQWASLLGRAGTLWPPEYQEVSPNSLETIAAAQRNFSRHRAQTRADSQRGSFDANMTEGQSASTCLLSCACRPASAWLDTLPFTKALEVKS
jgi:hypothetical protein